MNVFKDDGTLSDEYQDKLWDLHWEVADTTRSVDSACLAIGSDNFKEPKNAETAIERAELLIAQLRSYIEHRKLAIK